MCAGWGVRVRVCAFAGGERVGRENALREDGLRGGAFPHHTLEVVVV